MSLPTSILRRRNKCGRKRSCKALLPLGFHAYEFDQKEEEERERRNCHDRCLSSFVLMLEQHFAVEFLRIKKVQQRPQFSDVVLEWRAWSTWCVITVSR